MLMKYEKHNKGYKYILCAIDIFSRKVYCVPMKNKDNETVLNSFQEILKKAGDKPTIIISDSDSSFLSNIFTRWCDENEILQDNVAVGDHSALGVIDRFALTLKVILSKFREYQGTPEWVSILPKVINKYNNTVHSSLLGLTPNQVKDNVELINKLNMDKKRVNSIVSDLVKNDTVRIREDNIFKKGSEPKYSKKIYIVDSARGKTIYLEGGIKKKRDMLLKVSKETIGQGGVSVAEKATKEHRIKKLLNKEGIDESLIIQGKRRR
jgi:hypothetical protein